MNNSAWCDAGSRVLSRTKPSRRKASICAGVSSSRDGSGSPGSVGLGAEAVLPMWGRAPSEENTSGGSTAAQQHAAIAAATTSTNARIFGQGTEASNAS